MKIVSAIALMLCVSRPSREGPLPATIMSRHGPKVAPTSDGKLNVIAFGAHQDDCDQKAGGTAANWRPSDTGALLSRSRMATPGIRRGGGALAARRRAEAKESGPPDRCRLRRVDNHDGELLPSLKHARRIIRQNPVWKADLVRAATLGKELPSDHGTRGFWSRSGCRVHGRRSQRSPDTPALPKNPVFMYFRTVSSARNPFRPDIAVSIDDVVDKKIDMLDAHVSQMYEWLPWVDGALDKDRRIRRLARSGLRETRAGRRMPPCARHS